MKQSAPECPYCGAEMFDDSYSWHCMACHSSSPVVIYEEKCNTMTEAEKIDYARKAAFRRPIQKPLTLEELKALIDPGDEVVTYCEAKGAERTYANIWTGDLVIDVVGYEHKNSVCFENYGKTWRAWTTRPTDEERAAAPWEE